MTRKIFRELAEVRQKPCVSIYIPTDRIGDNKKGQIRFKNHIQSVRNHLQENGMQGRQVVEFTKPLEMLQEDPEIWRHLSDGLAVFLSPGKFAYSTFPIRFREFQNVGSTFYLLPLMPVFNGDGRFFILALSLNKARLFEGSRDYISEIAIEDLVPQRLQDTVGTDHEQKALQFRSGQAAGGHSIYHGQGAGKDYRKDEILKHLREVNRSLLEVLQDYDAPLVVACVDYIFALYRSVNSYPKLFPKNIPGNPDELHMKDLHASGWPLLKDHFLKHRRDTLRHYQFLSSKGRTTSIIEDIVHAAREGRIDTLFIEKEKQLWAEIDTGGNGISIKDEKTPGSICLLDMVAKDAFLGGARVYLLEREDMPEKESHATATLRF